MTDEREDRFDQILPGRPLPHPLIDYWSVVGGVESATQCWRITGMINHIVWYMS